MTRGTIISLWLIVISPFIGLFLLVNLTSIGVFGDLPTFDQLENPKNSLATEIISEDGVLLGTYFKENRSNAKYKEFPENLIRAFISTEDIRFREHSGIDGRALLRAIVGVIMGNSSSGGASTITQQLAKMLFTQQPSSGTARVMQKLKEWIIAAQLEKRYTKDEILTMYLNRFDWVNNAVGIKSASRVYFNKEPIDLNVEESAMLVGMLKNPSLYNPIRRKELTESRRNIVLYQMNKYEFIPNSLYDTLKKQSIILEFKKASHNEGLAPYFREYLRGELKKWCASHLKPDGSPYSLYTDGLKVYTTINSRLQQFAEEGMKTHISSLQKDFYKHWKGYTKAPYPDDFEWEQINEIIDQGMRRSERHRKLKKAGKSNEEIKKIFKKKVSMTLFSWDGEIDTVLSPRDSIWYNKYFLHSGMMSMDPKTGHVKAYVGGINHKYFKYDHVKIGKRQVGSTFKPFVYALAMQEGYSPCYEVSNVPIVFDKKKWGLKKDWVPKNSGDEYDEMSLTLKFGLANSINTVTAYIMKQFGPYAVVDLAKKIGIQSKLLAVPSLCLGTFDLSVYEMVGAYSTFVNKGVWTEPIFVTRIEDKNGVILEEFIPRTQEAMSKETADLIVRMLQGVVDGVYSPAAKKSMGTGVRLRSRYGFKNEMAGKTGTTQNQSDGYFMGITPNLVTGVWTGCEDRAAHFRSIYYGQGANMALPVFAEYMQRVYADTLETGIYPIDFDIPKSIDVKLDCGEAIQGGNNEEFEEEF
ncbi:MAG TPA: penicillin-binding protein [Flavobacteriales bacterium]|nr:penicillin-binding protein [Flavobacteriales bacterium]HIK63061.1 penicillin-binding protein [Flavobacteriales bacterium]